MAIVIIDPNLEKKRERMKCLVVSFCYYFSFLLFFFFITELKLLFLKKGVERFVCVFLIEQQSCSMCRNEKENENKKRIDVIQNE